MEPHDPTQDPRTLDTGRHVPAGPQVGVDEWVARSGERIERYQGWSGAVRRLFDRVPEPVPFLVFAAAVAFVPLLTSNDYVVRVGTDTLIFALLALGLNVAVGLAGLLDLGYIAFYGFAAYSFAMLSSPKFDVHWPTWASVPVIVLATVLLGFLLALPSRRLVGDYLAIVTLFFGQIFVTLTTQGYRISLFGLTGSHDVTGGPNGIANIDPFRVFGHKLETVRAYFYVALIAVVVIFVTLYFVNQSRTGRAWRALREDSLAAELMSMPVNRLKLYAVAFGAGVAGLAGSINAAYFSGAFPNTFDIPLLITVYAMVILGGAGSLSGVVLGAIVVNVMLEVLRTPEHARWVFYAVILVALLARLRPWRWLAAVLAGTAAFGLAVTAIVGAAWPRGTEGAIAVAGGDFTKHGWLADILRHWLVLPANTYENSDYLIGNYAFVGLIACVLLLTLARGVLRYLLLVPTLWLGAFVWETRLVEEPSTTRFLMLGAVLIVLMAARPQGLLGTPRVEIT